MDLIGKDSEHGVYAIAGEGAGLEEPHTLLGAEGFDDFEVEGRREVAFICDYEVDAVLRTLDAELAEPVGNGVEGFRIRYVKNEQTAPGVAIVQGRHGAETLGAARIPNLEFLDSAIGHFDRVLQKSGSDCYLVRSRENTLSEPEREGRFADAGIPKDDNFRFEKIRGWLLG